jgi:hypothetical protein
MMLNIFGSPVDLTTYLLSPIKFMNSLRVLSSLRKEPDKDDVTTEVLGFWTPRMAIHI